jgi:hypothetical protein
MASELRLLKAAADVLAAEGVHTGFLDIVASIFKTDLTTA